MVMRCAKPEAYKLFHQGTLALAQVEANGIRIDTTLLDRTIAKVGYDMEDLTEAMKASDVWRKWTRIYGTSSNLNSDDQLRTVLFQELGYTPKGVTELSKKAKVDATSLQDLDHPFVKQLDRLRKLKKLKSTYLEGVRREVVDGFLHPSFSLAGGNATDEDKGGAKTYRSSSSQPNFQNIPVRDPEQGALIRECFIPRSKNHEIVEFDFKGIEVGISCCYHFDPTLTAYVSDKSKDMHRDMAMELFLLDRKEVSKAIRHAAKNQFVFPQFYGSYYADCARDLWDSAVRGLRLETSGTPLLEHLAGKGITERGACDKDEHPKPRTFEYHVQQVEQDFWHRRFPVYTQWKKRWYTEYLRTGGFYLHSGFYIRGEYKRNQVLNYPIQGAAFHCLLWCLVRLQRWMTRNNMRSKLVGQIHDSIIGDLHRREADDVRNKAMEIMATDLPAAWKWITVPLEVEVEVAPRLRSWHHKKPWKSRDGVWEPEDKDKWLAKYGDWRA